MARAFCPVCKRPPKVCLCGFISPVDNLVEIGILQHPDETRRVKGSALIAQLSLTRCQTWVGEDFSKDTGLFKWLENAAVFLLYPPPSEAAEGGCISPAELNKQFQQAGWRQPIKILLIDATWKKSYKILQLNPWLQPLKRLAIAPQLPSTYRIRKQKSPESLSTLEAIYEALSQVEGDAQKFQPLLQAFDAMNQQQLAFRPVEHANKV